MPTNVLVVDDHQTFRESFCAMLTTRFKNIQIVPVENATSALRLIRQIPFDLLIVDYQLDAISGTQLIRQVRQHDTTAGRSPLPIVLMSSNPDMGVFARTLNVPFLHKPPDAEALNKVIRPLLACRAG